MPKNYSHLKSQFMTPKKLFNGCLISLGIFVVFVFAMGFLFSSDDTTASVEETPKHECPATIQKDGSLLIADKYTVYAGPNKIGVILPIMSQPPYFVLHFKEPTQVFETQELNGADLNTEYRYALVGDMKEENGKYIYYSGNRFISRQCLVESITNKEAIDGQIRGGYPFHIVMGNFAKDITEYIKCINLCINQNGKNETYTFYPNDGEPYNKILSGLIHQDIK